MRQCGVEDVDTLVVEGQWREEVPAEVALASGPAAALLAAERTALNFLGHLSGIATLTARYVEAVAGTGARILDTRKTTPGLRALEKAAVAAGGGHEPPHGPLRRDPDQGEPHRRSRAAWPRRSSGARTADPDLPVEVECRDLDEVAYALGTGADRLLLDNMDPETLREAVGCATPSAAPGGPVAGGLRRRQPGDGARDRRDRRRLHLGRRPHALGPDARLQPADRTRLTAPAAGVRSPGRQAGRRDGVPELSYLSSSGGGP